MINKFGSAHFHWIIIRGISYPLSSATLAVLPPSQEKHQLRPVLLNSKRPTSRLTTSCGKICLTATGKDKVLLDVEFVGGRIFTAPGTGFFQLNIPILSTEMFY
jgi:hypothetical protein